MMDVRPAHRTTLCVGYLSQQRWQAVPLMQHSMATLQATMQGISIWEKQEMRGSVFLCEDEPPLTLRQTHDRLEVRDLASELFVMNAIYD